MYTVQAINSLHKFVEIIPKKYNLHKLLTLPQL